MIEALLDFDSNVFDILNGLAGASRATDIIFVLLAEVVMFLMIAGLAVYAYKRGKVRARVHACVEALTSGIISKVVFVSLIRDFIFRERPFVAGEVTQLVSHNPSEASFPSGHSSFMFAMAFALFFYDKKWGAAYMALALVSGLSRVVVGVHYPLDIFAGIFVGALAAHVTHLIFPLAIRRLRRAKV